MSYRAREPVITSTALDPLFDDDNDIFDDFEEDCSQGTYSHSPPRTMRSPLSSPPTSPESHLSHDAASPSALTAPMPISSSQSRNSTSSRHSSSSSSGSSSSSSSGSDDSLDRGRRAVRQMMETHALASTARRKLVAEASRSEHKLRLLVGHANFLDACMYGIQGFDEEAIVVDDDEEDARVHERDDSERGRTQNRRGKRRQK